MKLRRLILLFLVCFSHIKAQQHTEPLIIFQRTPCFGQCPDFTFSLYKDGYAQYEGGRFAPLKGKYYKTFSKNEVKAIVKQFNAACFYTFKNEYTAIISDVPNTYITYNYKGKHKKVTDHWNAPQELRNLENSLDKVSNSEGWTNDSIPKYK
jgi:hypothetical protein